MANPVLVRSTRNGIIEKIHRGSICLAGEGNEVIFSAGDIRQIIYPRSALKYFQVLPLLLSGAAEHYGFSDEEIAVMCASHNGEERHVAAARSALHKAGIDEHALGCGPQVPLSSKAAEKLILDREVPADIHNNCSGKHAGFLALAKYLNAPLDSYLRPEHPVQAWVRKCVAQLCQIDEEKLWPGIDGCSAPNYGMPLFNLAIGYRNLMKGIPGETALNAACEKVVQVVSRHSYYIGGENRYCTEMMQAAKGKIIGKLGADGVYALGLHQGLGCAVKIDDGSTGPQYSVVQLLIEKLGILPQDEASALHHYVESEILNCKGIRTGFSTPAPGLFQEIPLEKING